MGVLERCIQWTERVTLSGPVVEGSSGTLTSVGPGIGLLDETSVPGVLPRFTRLR
jgi:hypothetical protein